MSQINPINFTFSDTIAGYVTAYDAEAATFFLETTDQRRYQVRFASNTYGWIANNLDEPRTWCSQDQMKSMMANGRYLFVYGIYYPEAAGNTFEAQFIIFPGKREGSYVFERQNWWIQQVYSIANFYLKAQFQSKPVNYANYRTLLAVDPSPLEAFL